MKYLLLLALLASCGSDLEENKNIVLQCVSNHNGTTCYGESIKCWQEYYHDGEMTCQVAVDELGEE